MSQKPKKSRGAAKKEQKAPRQEVKKPSGHVPVAMVSSRHGADMILRRGKGFSMGEVSDAGVSLRLAKKWGVPVDIRRRSVLEDNVSAVRNWVTHAKAVGKPEGEVKKLEEELVKVEKEVRKEAAKLKKEVKKVEKEVVEKVEEPVKARGRRKKPGAKPA